MESGLTLENSMLDIYVWNPSAVGNKQTSKGIKPIVKSMLKGQNVGHISLAVTIYEDQHNLTSLLNQFPELNFKEASPTYDSVAVESTQGTQYRRGKILKGLTAVNSFWPSKGVGAKQFAKNFFNPNSKIEPLYLTIEEDMKSEAKGEVMIEHFLKQSKGKIIPSSRQQELAKFQKERGNLEHEYDLVDQKINDISKELEFIQQSYPNLQFIPNCKNPLLEKKIKIKGKMIPGQGFLQDRDGKDFAASINYAVIMQELDDTNQALKETRNNFFNFIQNTLPEVEDEKLKILMNHYLTSEIELARLRSLNQTRDVETMKAIADMKSTTIRCLLMEAFKFLNIPLDSLIKIDNEIDKQYLKTLELSNLIVKLEEIKMKLSNLQDEKINIKKQSKQIITKENKLISEIEQFEQTVGKNADAIINLPTSESGRRYYIDEMAIMKYMVKQKKNAHYELFGENCARSVKNCILAGISEDIELRNKLLELPDFSKKFFNKSFIDTPAGVMKWLFTLSKGIDKLNADYEQEIKTAPSIR